MKKVLSLLLATVLLLSSLTVLSSCGAPEDFGSEISVYLGDGVYDLDPTDYVTDDNALQLMSLLYEPLFTVKKNGKLGYGAAKKYKVDKKERTITITLRETYWSDTVQVTAENFLYAWRNVLLNPSNTSPAAALLYDIENAVAVKNGTMDLYSLGVAAKGDTLTITYREGADYKQLLKNLASVATSPLRQDFVDQAPSYWSKKLNFSISNGPFSVETAGDYSFGAYTLVRNEGYHQTPGLEDPTKKVTPHILASFTLENGEKTELSYDDLLNKTVFFLGEASLADRKANAKQATVTDALSTYSYVFNTENPLFANENVRRALSLAIDRNALAEAVVFGKAATGLLPAGMADPKNGKSFRKTDVLSVSANLAEANNLLSSVDFSGLNKAFTLTVNDSEEARAMADIVKAAWESLDAGFSVTVNPVSSICDPTFIDAESADTYTIYDSAIQATVKNAAVGTRDFDVIGLDIEMFSDDAFAALAVYATDFSGNGASYTGESNLRTSRAFFGGWSSEDYDALILAAYNASNQKERSELLHRAEELLLTSGAVVPVVFNQNFAFVSSDLSKVKFNGFGHFVFTDTKQKNYKDYLG